MAPGVVTASRAAEASLSEAVAAASGALEAAAACLGGGGGEGAAERASTLEEAMGRYAAASAELRRQVGVCARVSASDGADGPPADVMSYEYDVFACDAFVEDQGKWLRLMPDADFVPT